MITAIKQFVKDNVTLPSLMIASLVLFNMAGFLPRIPQGVQVAMCGLCFIVYSRLHMQMNIKMIAYLIWLAVSTMLAMPDPVFKSWSRLAMFTTAFVIVSPMFQSAAIRAQRRKMLNMILLVGFIFGFVSFFCFFLGINMMVRYGEVMEEEIYASNAGLFSGITHHSMLLGPMAGIGAVSMAYLYFVKKKNVLLLLALPCFGSMMFSASRTCLVCTVVSCLVLFYKYSNSSKKRFIQITTVVSLILIATSPLWNGAMSLMEAKQASHKDDTSFFDSRSQKVEARWGEFTDSPIWGQGFSAIDKRKDVYNPETGTIEPGTSWLFALSMSGIVGLVFLISIYRKSVRAVFAHQSNISILYAALIVFLGLHLLTEGYLFAASNPMSIVAWLVIACGYDFFYETNNSL